MEKKPMSDDEFLMLMRQMFFFGISAIERYLGKSPSTKERLDFWRKCHYDTTHSQHPEWETTETSTH